MGTETNAGSPQIQPLLTPQEAARALAISSRKLWSMTAGGAIPAVRIGRAVRYDLADLRAWIDDQKAASRNCLS